MISIKMRGVNIDAQVRCVAISATVEEVSVEAEAPSEALVSLIGWFMQAEEADGPAQDSSHTGLSYLGSYGTVVRIGDTVLVRNSASERVRTGECRRSAATWKGGKLVAVVSESDSVYYQTSDGGKWMQCIPMAGNELYAGAISDPLPDRGVPND